MPADISQKLIASPVIRKVTFTGSVPVGPLLAAQAAQQLKPATMELGGHAPVLDDTDVGKGARACVAFKFRNAGQVCLSPSRFFVQATIAPAFTRRFVQLAQELRVGDGFQPDVQMGPLQSMRQEGGTHAGGGRPCPWRPHRDRWQAHAARWVLLREPTVLTGLDEGARILREEPFCPVAPIMTFETIDEAITRANATEFGLAAYAFTNRMDRAAEFAERIEAG